VARMSIDDMVQRDPRITKLAQSIGWSRRETMGCLVLDVWPICYDQREHIIVAELIDIAAAKDGFAAAMVACGLAEWVRGNRKVRIKGAKERIEYLDHKKRAGHVGGIKSAESRYKKSSTGEILLKQRGSTPQAAGNPSVPDSASASASASVPVPPLVLDHPESEPSGSPGFAAVVAKFDALYKRASGGAAPTWGKKPGGQLNTLLAKHAAAEVIRRIEILFSSPPAFLSGSLPDVGTLVQHFDKLAAPSRAPASRSQTALDAQMERIRLLEAEEASDDQA
jgi:hypothetical protein